MKKVLTIFILTIVSVVLFLSLGGCGLPSVESQIKKVDGYYVYEESGGAEHIKQCSLMGADKDKIINGCLTIPDKIGGVLVKSVGAKRKMWVGEDWTTPMYENDEIKKIVINHRLTIYQSAFSNLKELVEIEINENVVIEHNAFYGNSLSSISLTNFDFFHNLNYFLDTSTLRSIRVKSNDCYNKLGMSHPENVVALYISNYTKLPETSFEKYNSLSSLIIPETISYIDKNAFKNSDVDVFVRLDEETFKQKLNNGWDDGINVEWGFSDEIVVFDSIGGTEIKTDSTQKNYLIVKMGEKIIPPSQPTRDGYAFLGWFKDYTLLELWNFETDIVEDSMVLIAGWQKI